jgi:glycosyltransferase involved in cell wall biosynthesis
MKIMIVGKFPPIQGGESTKAYWLARGLGALGHKVTVVTNPEELDGRYLCQIEPPQIDQLQPRNVEIKSVPKSGPMNVIPPYEPYPTRLASVCIEAIEEERPDLIIGWFLLPYAEAGFLAAKIFGIRFVVQHAGSDLTRLLPQPSLRPVLTKILREADGVLTYQSSRRMFVDMGCRRVLLHRPCFPPEFCPEPLLGTIDRGPLEGRSERRLLFLGKLNRGKGLPQLLKAFGPIGASGEGELLIAGDGILRKEIESEVSVGRLPGVRLIRAVAPWRVPELMHGAMAVVAPECRFGVAIHRSRLPYEAMLCGRVAVVGEEIQPRDEGLRRCCQVVSPDDTDGFRAQLRQILGGSKVNDRVRSEYPYIRSRLGEFETYLREFLANLASLL